MFDPATGSFIRELPTADCEYTAPGAETEAVDCWEPATHRQVRDGVTVALLCAEHSGHGLSRGATVELIDTIQEV